MLSESRLRLAGVSPEKRERLKLHLGAVLKKPRPMGRIEISVPRRKGQGHADDVSALVLAVWQARASAVYEDPASLAQLSAEMDVLMTNPRRAQEPPTYVDHRGNVADMWTNPRYL